MHAGRENADCIGVAGQPEIENLSSPTVFVEFKPEVLHPTAGGAGEGAAAGGDDEEEVCGVCLEKPPEEGFVKLWCCNNVLCVRDAQHIGRCPFCRTEPLVWEIEK